MKPRTEALLRLFAVQASYTYERMAGIGVGHASAPLLRDVFAKRSVRERREAVARSADFFNSHPYLAGVAVGAEVRAEQDGVPGAVISRLRTALSGPLGVDRRPVDLGGMGPGAGRNRSDCRPLGRASGRLSASCWCTTSCDAGSRPGAWISACAKDFVSARRCSDHGCRGWRTMRSGSPRSRWALPSRSSPGACCCRRPRLKCSSPSARRRLAWCCRCFPATRARVNGLRFGLGLLGLAILLVGGLR